MLEINFEAVGDEQIISENVSDVDFIDDENDFDDNVEDCYAFTNVSRSYEDTMKDLFIYFNWSQEANDYCMDSLNSKPENGIFFSKDEFYSTL